MAVTLDDEVLEAVFFELVVDWFLKHPKTAMTAIPMNVAANLRRDFSRLGLVVTSPEPLTDDHGELLDITWKREI